MVDSSMMNTKVFFITVSGFYSVRKQDVFLENSIEKIKKLFQIPAMGETVVQGLWMFPFSRRGFVFTNRGLYWNIGGVLGRISKDTKFESGISVDSKKRKILYIKNTDQEILFNFCGMNSNLLKKISDFINSGGFANVCFNNHGNNDKRIGFVDYWDKLLLFLSRKKNGLISFLKPGKKQKPGIFNEQQPKDGKKAFDERTSGNTREEHNKTQDSNSPGVKNKKGTEQSFRVLRKIFSFTFDFSGSMIFLFALLIAIKPVLIKDYIKVNWISTDSQSSSGSILYSAVNKAGENIFDFKFENNRPENADIPDIDESKLLRKAEFSRNSLLCICILLYILIKLVVILTSDEGKKIVSVFLLILMILNSFLFADKFLIFITMLFFIYLSFEILCNFTKREIIAKIIMISFSSILVYFFIHILVYPELKFIFLLPKVSLL